MNDEQLLAQAILYHNDLYFNNSAPEISDLEYDDLVSRLRAINPDNPALREVGAKSNRNKVAHMSVMGSVNKCHAVEEIVAWTRSCTDPNIIATPKVDGLAVELRYAGGQLIRAVTRGDGEFGQDVTANARAVTSVKQHISFGGPLRIRGEVFMRYSIFYSMQEGANPRNMASGKFTCNDPQETARANLDFVAYDAFANVNLWTTEQEKLDWLVEVLGHPDRVVPYRIARSEKDVQTFVSLMERKRPQIDYAIDGLVFTFNSILDQAAAGWAGNCPRFRVAYKFRAEQKVTKVQDVIWQVGRTGRVTPVLQVEPVSVDGSVISFVTLHNRENFEELDLAVGDEVLIEKAGDIIPQVVRKVRGQPRISYLVPNPFSILFCPTCESRLVDNGPYLQCMNANCKAQLEMRLLHYFRTFGVLGIGPAIVKELCDCELVTSIPDIYLLDKARLYTILGPMTSEAVFRGIQQTRDVRLALFLQSLGIDRVGATASAKIANKFKTIEAVCCTNVAELTPLVGPATAVSLIRELANLRAVIDKLLEYVKVRPVGNGTVSGSLNGKSFCLTGAMSKNRALIEQDIQDAGGTVRACGPGLTYLVQADPASTSSKSQRAKQLGIPIISEGDLYKMIGGGK